MRSIKVKWDSLEIAFERNAPDLHSYIDRDNGDVLVVVDSLPEDAEKRHLVGGNPERFVKIEPASSREQYRWMERFVVSVQELPLRERLLIAIDGKGAFRRFKDVLLSFPAERERWFNYRANLLHYHINQWFLGKGLLPEPPPPWGEVEVPPDPPEAAERLPAPGQGPADLLRLQVRALVDALPACELHSARTFLEYLRDRGSAGLTGTAPPSDRAASEASIADDGEFDVSPELEPELEAAPEPACGSRTETSDQESSRSEDDSLA